MRLAFSPALVGLLGLAGYVQASVDVASLSAFLQDTGLLDFCIDFTREPLEKRAPAAIRTVTRRTTQYTTRTVLRTATTTRVTTQIATVVRASPTVYSTSTVVTILPPARKRSLHRHILAKRDEALPDELVAYPLEAIYEACYAALVEHELEKRAKKAKKAKAVTRTVRRTVQATRTVTRTTRVTRLSTTTRTTTQAIPVTSTRTTTSTCRASKPTASAYSPLLSKGGVNIGMLPDYGYSGPRNTMADLNSLITVTGNKHATFGYYAQAYEDTPFDGSQLFYIFDDLLASGATFEPAVMPIHSWAGFTFANNSQAVRVCEVMRNFTDAGIDVRLRFAHEANWYASDGTYAGGPDDFKEGWATVAAACKEIAPSVKMFWTPNIANLAEYKTWAPADLSTIQFFSVDYYPPQGINFANNFVRTMKGIHDYYGAPSRLFAIGETALGWTGSYSDRIAWLASIVNAKSKLKYLTSVSWFNYNKEYEYRICDPQDAAVTEDYVKYLTNC